MAAKAPRLNAFLPIHYNPYGFQWRHEVSTNGSQKHVHYFKYGNSLNVVFVRFEQNQITINIKR